MGKTQCWYRSHGNTRVTSGLWSTLVSSESSVTRTWTGLLWRLTAAISRADSQSGVAAVNWNVLQRYYRHWPPKPSCLISPRHLHPVSVVYRTRTEEAACLAFVLLSQKVPVDAVRRSRPHFWAKKERDEASLYVPNDPLAPSCTGYPLFKLSS